MRLIAVKDIRPDMVLGKSIFTQNNMLLLGAGYRIPSEFKTKLIDRGLNHVYIMEKGTEEIIPEDIISDELRMQVHSQLAQKTEEIGKYFSFKDLNRRKIYDLVKSGYLKDFNITYDMKIIVSNILGEMAQARILKTMLFKTKNTYYMDHALNTTILSILIGKKYRFNNNELLTLAVGSFLHDFGKIVLEKLNESSKGTMADELMREHPIFGYLLVHRSSGASPMVCQIINQHHEQQDGKGYPIGLKGENLPPVTNTSFQRNTRGMIFRLAEICSVANTYDNLVMNPNSEKQLTPTEAVGEIIMKSGTVLNKHIVGTLTKIVPAFPVGTVVRINDIFDPTLIGYRGVVAKVNEEHIDRPVVILIYDRSMRKIKPRIIDTSKISKVDLELVL